MKINYEHLAKEATKSQLWVEAPGGNKYADLASLEPPKKGVLVDLGHGLYTIIEEEDLILLTRRKYWMAGSYVSSKDRYLHRDIMMRRLSMEDKEIADRFEVDHRDRDPCNNMRSNLRWVNGRLNNMNRSSSNKDGLPTGIRKRGKKYQVRISYNGDSLSRTCKTLEEAIECRQDLKTMLITNDPDLPILDRLNGDDDTWFDF